MAVKKWSKKQRAKFMATVKARKRKPYRKPGRISVVRPGNREILIRIALV
jgi:hypothetical protein